MGLRARGGFEVDITWSDGRLSGGTIRSTCGGRCRLRTSLPVTMTSGGSLVSAGEPWSEINGFETEAGRHYEVTPREAE